MASYQRNDTEGKHFELEEVLKSVKTGKIQVGCQGEVLYYESGEVLAQAAQRGCGCTVPGGVQGLVGWDPAQPGLVLMVGGPAYGRGIGSS